MKPAHLCFTLVCLAQIFAIMAPREAKAWGPEGDRIVALVADRLLQAHDPAVQKKVAAILATDKDNSWTKTDIAGERLMALRFLLNFTGDLHQPLAAIEHHDQGGDCIAVLPPGAKTPVRLSIYWNDVLVTEAESKDPITAADQIVTGLSPGDIAKWSSGTLQDWARESYDIAKSVTYSYLADLVAGRHALPQRRGGKDSCGAISVYRIDSADQDRAIAAVRAQLDTSKN